MAAQSDDALRGTSTPDAPRAWGTPGSGPRHGAGWCGAVLDGGRAGDRRRLLERGDDGRGAAATNCPTIMPRPVPVRVAHAGLCTAPLCRRVRRRRRARAADARRAPPAARATERLRVVLLRHRAPRCQPNAPRRRAAAAADGADAGAANAAADRLAAAGRSRAEGATATASAAGAAAFGGSLQDEGGEADYSQAARAFRTLASELGGVEKVVAAFECIGVSAPTTSPRYCCRRRHARAAAAAEATADEGRRRMGGRGVVGTASWRDVPAGVDRVVDAAADHPDVARWRVAEQPVATPRACAHGVGWIRTSSSQTTTSTPSRARPGWLPLYESLVHAPIRRVASSGMSPSSTTRRCLDLDLLLGNPLDSILDEPRSAALVERLIDADVHPTLARAGACRSGSTRSVPRHATHSSRHPGASAAPPRIRRGRRCRRR